MAKGAALIGSSLGKFITRVVVAESAHLCCISNELKREVVVGMPIWDCTSNDSLGSLMKRSLGRKDLRIFSRVDLVSEVHCRRNVSAALKRASGAGVLTILPLGAGSPSVRSLSAPVVQRALPLFDKGVLEGTMKISRFHSAAKHEFDPFAVRLCSPEKKLTSLKRKLSTESWAGRLQSSAEKVKDVLYRKPRAIVGAGVTAKPAGFQKASKEIFQGVASSKPISGVQKTISHYKEAAGLQVEAFWKRNYLVVVGAIGLGVCLILWRIMFGVASMFVSLSEGMAKFGFLALAASVVTVGGVVLRARFTINPDSVYRIAMRKLNTSAAVLEVMGAPLSGTDLRAYIMSGGGLRFKGFRPRFTGKRCFIIFPIRGSERRGLVSIEVKKKRGQYDFKLLAVDVPTAGADQRLYLVGDELEYDVGGGLIAELRDPIVKAMAAQKEFEEQDIKEEEEEEKRRAMEAENDRSTEHIADVAKNDSTHKEEKLKKAHNPTTV